MKKRKTDNGIISKHAYNSSYLGGRDQEDLSSKPAQANNLRNPISKKPFTKMGW
jgi:hypothetical protein